LIYTTKKIERVFSDDQFKLQELQTRFKCFVVCFAMVQVMMSLWSLFIEFLGSYNRCRMSNGVMSCVLGPTSFYLKIWVNILIKRWTLECCCVLDDLHLGSSWSSFGFIMYEWTHEFLGVSYASHMNFWAKYGLFHIHQKVTFAYLPRDWCRRDKVDSASSCSCFEGLCGPCTVPTHMRVYLWLSRTHLICFCFSPIVLFIN